MRRLDSGLLVADKKDHVRRLTRPFRSSPIFRGKYRRARIITDFVNDRTENMIGGYEIKGDEQHKRVYGELGQRGLVSTAGWKDRLARIADPVAGLGGFGTPEGTNQPLPAALAAVTFVSGDFSPYNGVTFMPLPNRTANFDVFASFTFALAATPGTLLITSGVGTALTAKNLGASVATATLGTSGTAGLIVDGLLTQRTATIPGGSAGSWYFTGRMLGKLATSGNGALDVTQIIGLTAATGDSTAANGFWMTMTGTATSVTVQTQQLRFISWQ